MSVSRIVVAIAALGLTIWFLGTLFGGGSKSKDSAPVAGELSSSSQCRDCHVDVFAEWEESQHAMAWTNPAVRFLSNDFANQDCIDCHAPRPVFVTGIGERVLPREERRVDGVDCISCHALPASAGGGVAGTVSLDSAPCRPVATLDLARVEFCAGCHNQHLTVDQWRESDWPDRDMDCIACHMPFRDGDPNAGRDHRFHGGLHMPTLLSAVDLRGAFNGGAYRVELENVGAGHSFPTDERSRAADLFWRKAGTTGADAWKHLYRIRDPYRHETDIPSTLLHAGKTLSLEVPDVPDGESIEVSLFYKRSPYWIDPERPDPDSEAVLMHSVTIQP